MSCDRCVTCHTDEIEYNFACKDIYDTKAGRLADDISAGFAGGGHAVTRSLVAPVAISRFQLLTPSVAHQMQFTQEDGPLFQGRHLGFLTGGFCAF
jgi:hypothetical protein